MVIISLLLLVHWVLCTVSSDGFLKDELRSSEDDLDTTDALNERWLGDCPCRVNRSRTLHQRKTRTTNNGLRLVAQSGNAWEGRVEVFYNGSWGTVCDDGFDVIDARVVCRMLGYNTEFPTVHLRSFYGIGTGSIYLDNVRCNGKESSIIHCGHNGFGVHDCGPSEEVGVNCRASTLDTKLVRVVSLRSSSEGRVESFVNGSWATVCDAGFDVSHAISVCRSLGFSERTPVVHKGAHYGPGSGNIQDLNGTLCSGKDNIYNCGTAGNCSHSNDVGIDCWPNSTIAGDVVRLASSTNVSEGRVEVFINGDWGSVCDVEFDVTDARVICRMLGFANNHPTVHPGAYYGAGTGNIWLENVRCTGSESDILQCGYSGFGLHNCNHAQDVGINCAIIAPLVKVRLANGDNSWEGRVDVWDRECWVPVCRNGFDLKDARVICRMLGYNEDQQSLYNYSQNGQNAEVMWLYSLGCNGSEHNIFQCPRTELLPLDCDPSDGVGVRCRTTANTNWMIAVYIGVASSGVILIITTIIVVIAVKKKKAKQQPICDRPILNRQEMDSTYEQPCIIINSSLTVQRPLYETPDLNRQESQPAYEKLSIISNRSFTAKDQLLYETPILNRQESGSAYEEISIRSNRSFTVSPESEEQNRIPSRQAVTNAIYASFP